MLWKHVDWKAVQQKYDEGHTWSMLQLHFGISRKNILTAKRHGLLVTPPNRYHNKKYLNHNWKDIQKFYDRTRSLGNTIKKFNLTKGVVYTARKKGLFVVSVPEAPVVFPWKKIQQDYDEGHSIREISRMHSVSESTLYKAKCAGRFITRNPKEAAKLFFIKNGGRFGPAKHTVETKEKISMRRREFLANHPDKIPYILYHASKGPSYPESYFIKVFKEEGIPLGYHKRVGLYELDFYNDVAKLDVEIDGNQHHTVRAIEHDRKRAERLAELGWTTYRISWSDFQKKTLEEKKKIISEIKNIIRAAVAQPGKAPGC